LERWLLIRQGLPKDQKKGLDSAVMLTSWRLRKEHNARVFNNTELTVSQVLFEIFSKGDQWI
jgi:hypothetical protein